MVGKIYFLPTFLRSRKRSRDNTNKAIARQTFIQIRLKKKKTTDKIERIPTSNRSEEATFSPLLAL